ncbi:MAG: N-acetylneuraminate synthase family protein [Candidatus Omnitrophota bacterium]
MPVKFIAEVSSNHNKDLKRCLRFIDVAAKIGCDAVKFQLFKIERLFASEVLKKNKDIQKRKQWELPIGFLPRLYKRSKKIGLQFGCTPFYMEAVDELKPYVDFYKISSYDLLRLDLIKACGLTGIPVILSTGMANMAEIKEAVDALRLVKTKDISLLHCVSNYPTLVKDCNLAVINTLRDKFRCKVGWSDHTVSDIVLFRAVYTWNAEIIEFHFDLDTKGREFNIGHCWLPEQISSVIKKIKEGQFADGKGVKEPKVCELRERNWRADYHDGLRPLMETRKRLK